MEKYWSFYPGIILVASTSPLRATTPKGPFVVRIVVFIPKPVKPFFTFLPVAKKCRAVSYEDHFDVFIFIFYVNIIITLKYGGHCIAVGALVWTLDYPERWIVPFSTYANAIPQTREN